jgi:hypothetical protein
MGIFRKYKTIEEQFEKGKKAIIELETIKNKEYGTLYSRR